MNSRNSASFISVQVVLIILGFLASGSSERILSVAFWSSKSHKITYQPLLEALAAKGHNVTVLSPVPSKKSLPNMQEILSVDFEDFVNSGKVEKMENVFEMKDQNKWIIPTHFIQLVIDYCEFTLDQPHIHDLRKEQFDLVLMPMLYNECAAPFAHSFNTSTILISPISVVGQISTIYGNPSPTSFVPNAFTGYSDQMTFLQRVTNFLAEGLIRAIYNFKFVPAIERVYRDKFNDPNFPSIETILKNSSLMLSNSHFSLSKARPFLPDTVEVGGMHCHPARELPKVLNDFVESSGSNGFVLFSMGSNARSCDMPEHKLRQFVEAFSKLEQKVLWKWELDTPIPDLPQNVKLSKWLPQQDLLGHPKIKVFVTHGGFGSTTEAACHGTPIVGIPMFADQDLNMESAVKAGFGLKVDFSKLNSEMLVESIQKVVNTTSYKENALLISRALRDQPMGALDRAVYWTEYVMRHKGAVHLRSAARDLNFFQYHSLDVIVFLVAGSCLALWLVFLIISYFFLKVLKNFNYSTSQKSNGTKKQN